MTLTIKLSDKQASTLRAKAEAEGLSVEDWIRSLAQNEDVEARPSRPIADVILENMRDVPAEMMGRMPADGASEHDHYIYGWPKKK